MNHAIQVAFDEEWVKYAFFQAGNLHRMDMTFIHAPISFASELGIDVSASPTAAMVLLRELPLRHSQEPWYFVFGVQDIQVLYPCICVCFM